MRSAGQGPGQPPAAGQALHLRAFLSATQPPAELVRGGRKRTAGLHVWPLAMSGPGRRMERRQRGGGWTQVSRGQERQLPPSPGPPGPPASAWPCTTLLLRVGRQSPNLWPSTACRSKSGFSLRLPGSSEPVPRGPGAWAAPAFQGHLNHGADRWRRATTRTPSLRRSRRTLASPAGSWGPVTHLPEGPGSQAGAPGPLRSSAREFGAALCVGLGRVFHTLLALGGGPGRDGLGPVGGPEGSGAQFQLASWPLLGSGHQGSGWGW